MTKKSLFKGASVTTVLVLILIIIMSGTALAHKHNDYSSITDGTPPLSADGTEQLVASISGSTHQGGESVTTFNITINGSVASGDVTSVLVYESGPTLCGSQSGLFGSGSNVAVPSSCGKPSFPIEIYVTLAASASGKTVGVTLASTDGANDVGLPISSSNLAIGAANSPPSLTIDQPAGGDDEIALNDSFNIQYDLSDAEDVATVDFYYETDGDGAGGTAIAACQNQIEGTNLTCAWDTTGVPANSYYVYGVADDTVNSSVTVVSSGTLVISAPPSLTVSEPDGTGDTVTVGDPYSITYTLDDTDDVVTAAFYYDTDNTGLDGTAITGPCATGSEGTGVTCSWDTTGMTPGNYYVYGITDDGVNPQVSDYSPGQITINTAATTQELNTFTDDSADTGVPVTNHRMAKITTPATGGGAALTQTQVTVNGTLSALTDIKVYWNTVDNFGTATEVGSDLSPTVGLTSTISLTGAGSASGFLYYTISIPGGATGDFSLTVDSMTGQTTDNIPLPQTTASRSVTSNSTPTLTVSEPDGASDTVTVGDPYSITYTLDDTDDVVTAAFYYDTDNTGLDGTAITGPCAAASEGTGVTCSWDTTGMTPGSYYVYGITNDGVNPQVSDYSPGQITINTAVCSRTDPNVSMGSDKTIGVSGTTVYTISITNNDSAACANTTFSVTIQSEVENNVGSFTLPSTLSPSPCNVSIAAGSSDSTCTVEMASNGSGNAGDTLDTTMRTSSANHNNVDTAVRTTISSMLHNSDNLGSSKWSAESGWGIASGKYGEFVCETCHTKSTTNIKRIRTSVTAPDPTPSDFPGSGETIVLDKVSGTAQQYAAGQGIFGDDTACSDPAYTNQTDCEGAGGTWTLRTTSDRICEVCHSITNYHRYDTTSQTNFGHNNAADCTGCHPHSAGFLPTGGECITCHDGVPGGATYVTRDVVGTTSGTGDFTQSSRHVFGGTVSNWDCIVCHREGDETKASGSPSEVGTTTFHNNTGGIVVDLRDVDNPTSGWTWDKNNITDAMLTSMDTFCMKCHDSDSSRGAGLGGASGINVRLTGGLADGVNLDNTRALTPFNETDEVSAGTGGGTVTVTGYERTSVLDVYGQFDTANPSHHAVRGQAYTSHNANWGDGAWVDRTLKSGQALITDNLYESATLHCADCHTVDQNAHGGANGFMLQASSIDNTCYLCHNSNVYSNNSSTLTRWEHDNESQAWGNDGAVIGNYNGNTGSVCLLCHGGLPYDSTGSLVDGFGGIHGLPYPAADCTGGTSDPDCDPRSGEPRYRFQGGAWMAHKPSSWTGTSGGTSTCYFETGANDWSACTRHADTTPYETGRTTDPQYSRGVPGSY